ncbi:GNAT family N-acetyltransferase [Brachybacterium epidermidis]|uniref:GNAT family N-acetyltransferase n=1 Tax=Brachybacterium epidermidis TaxID=2781983 RepID=UPI00398E9CF1
MANDDVDNPLSHPEFEIRHELNDSRFVAVEGEDVVGMLTYERTGDRVSLLHTVTDPGHRSEGIASALVRTAFTDARAASMRVVVICPFVESWLARHPEQEDIVVDEGAGR